MEIFYLSRKQVEQMGVSMKEVIEAVDRGFWLKGLGKTEMPPKPGIHAVPAYVIEVDAAGLKWGSGYPSNVEKGLP